MSQKYGSGGIEAEGRLVAELVMSAAVAGFATLESEIAAMFEVFSS